MSHGKIELFEVLLFYFLSKVQTSCTTQELQALHDEAPCWNRLLCAQSKSILLLDREHDKFPTTCAATREYSIENCAIRGVNQKYEIHQRRALDESAP